MCSTIKVPNKISQRFKLALRYHNCNSSRVKPIITPMDQTNHPPLHEQTISMVDTYGEDSFAFSAHGDTESEQELNVCHPDQVVAPLKESMKAKSNNLHAEPESSNKHNCTINNDRDSLVKSKEKAHSTPTTGKDVMTSNLQAEEESCSEAGSINNDQDQLIYGRGQAIPQTKLPEAALVQPTINVRPLIKSQPRRAPHITTAVVIQDTQAYSIKRRELEARRLCCLGFFFPLLWLIGAIWILSTGPKSKDLVSIAIMMMLLFIGSTIGTAFYLHHKFESESNQNQI